MEPRWRSVVVTTARCLGSVAKSLLDAAKEDEREEVDEKKTSGHSEGMKSASPNAADAGNTESRVA
jgi:hypothetical protein